MKNYLFFLLIIGLNCFGQNETSELQTIFRVNALSPGIELELPLNQASSLSINSGIGISGSYKNLSYTNSGITYFISPFMDLSYKKFYNIDKRLGKNKNILGNSEITGGLDYYQISKSLNQRISLERIILILLSVQHGVSRELLVIFTFYLMLVLFIILTPKVTVVFSP